MQGSVGVDAASHDKVMEKPSQEECIRMSGERCRFVSENLRADKVSTMLLQRLHRMTVVYWSELK